MNLTTVPSFELTGLHIHTTWHNNQAKTDIAKLWKRFYLEDVSGQLDYSVDDTVYLLYTDYSNDDKQGFSVWLGMQTKEDSPLVSGCRRLIVPQLTYYQFNANSELPEDMNLLWEQVHTKNGELNRIYRCDFECYPDEESGQLFISTSDEAA